MAYLPQPSPASSSLLLSFPKEVVANVCMHLSIPSLVNLARVSRAFSHLTNHPALWASLRLYLADRYDVLPPAAPTALKGEELRKWTTKQERLIEARGRSALKKLLETLLSKADQRRWALVKRIELDPRPGTVLIAIRILTLCEPALAALAIRGRSLCSTIAEYQTLEPHFLNAQFHFPSLTLLHLSPNSGCSVHILPYLCNSAPSLTSVNVVLRRSDPRELREIPEYPAYRGPTVVCTARLEMTGCSGHMNEELTTALTNFISCSPLLRQLSLPHDGIHQADIEEVMEHLIKLEDLEELHWPVGLFDYQTEARLEGLPALRRLVLACHERKNWVEVLDSLLQEMPKLEALYIDISSLSLQPSSPPSSPQTHPVQAMTPNWGYHLRHRTPCLRILHTLNENIDKGDLNIFRRLDAIEGSGVEMGHISSIRRGTTDLLHARIRSYLVETSDKRMTPDTEATYPFLQYNDRTAFQRMAARKFAFVRGESEGLRCKRFRTLSHPVWLDYTSYDDLPVPLRIVRQMRAASGLKEKEWRLRGVKVNSAAWAILQRWHAKELVSLGKSVKPSGTNRARRVEKDESEGESGDESDEGSGESEHGCEEEDCSDDECLNWDYCITAERAHSEDRRSYRPEANGKRWDQYSQSWIWGPGL